MSDNHTYITESVRYIEAIQPKDFVITNTSTWILKIDMKSGLISLNPEIPQEQAVHDFVEALSTYITAYKDIIDV